jgi:UDP-glucose 4-epimerase
MSTYLITGATGFIGKRLVKLLIAKHHKVVLMTRKPVQGHDSIVFDFENGDYSKINLKGIDVIFHLAGIAHKMKSFKNQNDLYKKINSDSVLKLAEVAIKYNVKKFIFVSTVKAGGIKLNSRKMISEIDQNTPEGIYAKSKRDAELRVLALADNSKMFLSIIRPALVYGPGVKGNLDNMLKAIKKGWFPPLPRVSNSRSMVHVDDLVEAIYFVSNESKANNEIFNVTDGRAYTSREIYDAMCYSLGKPIPKWEVPLFVFKIIALISKKKRTSISKLLGDESYSSKKIQSFGFKVKRSLKEMNETSF